MRYYIERKVSSYLNKKLDDGDNELVYGLSSYWGTGRGLGRFSPFYDAAWYIQGRLIRESGYQECPCCYWATHCSYNHGTWCREQFEKLQSND
jgi:hypothetical protein